MSVGHPKLAKVMRRTYGLVDGKPSYRKNSAFDSNDCILITRSTITKKESKEILNTGYWVREYVLISK